MRSLRGHRERDLAQAAPALGKEAGVAQAGGLFGRRGLGFGLSLFDFG